MGLFDKKYCDFCGEKISFLGNRKVEDGNMCTDCAKKISPFMTDRRRTSVAEMKEHFQYREENKNRLSLLRDAQAIGEDSVKILISKRNGVFAITKTNAGNLESANPDVINITDIKSIDVDKKEYKQEEFCKDSQGNRKSYNPRRFKIDYDYIVKINVQNKWFDDVSFKLNGNRVESTNNFANNKFENMMYELKQTLTNFVPNSSHTSDRQDKDAEQQKLLEEARRMSDPHYAAQEMERRRCEALKEAARSANPMESLFMGTMQNNPSATQGNGFVSMEARPSNAENSAQNMIQAPAWDCPYCGKTGITSKFCTYCGAQRSN